LVLVVLVLLVAQTQRMVTTVMIAVFHLWSWRKVVEVVVRGLMVPQDLVVAVAVVRVVRVDREGAVRSGLMGVILLGQIAVAAVAGVWVALAGMEELLLVMAVMAYHQVYLEHLLIEEQAVLVVEGTVQVRRLLVVMVVVVTVQVMQQAPLPEHPTRDQGVEGVRTRQGKSRTVQPVARES